MTSFLDNAEILKPHIRANLRPEIITAFDRLREAEVTADVDSVVLGGGIGWGRTTLASLRLFAALRRAAPDDALRDRLGVRENVPLSFEVLGPNPRASMDALKALSDASPELEALEHQWITRAVLFPQSGVRVTFREAYEADPGYIALGGIVEEHPADDGAVVFRRLRSRMRADLQGGRPGSLTWCVNDRPVIHDPRTFAWIRPMWGTLLGEELSRPFTFGPMWARIADGRLTLGHRGPAGSGSHAEWHRIPREFEGMLRNDTAGAARCFFGLRVV